MSANDQEEAAKCPHCGHDGPPIDILCDACGNSLLQYDRISLVLLLVAGLATVALYRRGISIWLLYALVVSGLIHLYAVVFSKGAAIKGAALWVGGLVLAAFAAELPTSSSQGGPWNALHIFFEDRPFLLPTALWAMATIWGFLLGRNKTLPVLKLSASYFLAAGTFVLGLWGLLGFAISIHAESRNLYQYVVLATLIV